MLIVFISQLQSFPSEPDPPRGESRVWRGCAASSQGGGQPALLLRLAAPWRDIRYSSTSIGRATGHRCGYESTTPVSSVWRVS